MCVTELAFMRKGCSRGRRRGRTSTSLLQYVYSNPRHRGQKFKALIGKLKATILAAGKKMAKMGDPIALICGDFNAQHEELWYTVTTAKGRHLLEDAAEGGFTLLTNSAQPSKIGTSTARDTNPDLALALLPQRGHSEMKKHRNQSRK
ncbi:hypothetical protein MRX96_020308 [Rhipicephalus microplus]